MEGKKDRVGVPAHRTPDAADAELLHTARQEDAALIVAMDGQAARIAARTAQFVERKGIKDTFVISF